MTPLDRILLARAQEQSDAPREEVGRVECACGCGAWFYQRKGQAGRPRTYVNADHVEFARLKRRVAYMQRKLGFET